MNPNQRTYDQNSQVIFVDEKGVKHSALVTVWWGNGDYGNSPSCNLAYVSDDNNDRDDCGRTVKRSTSVSHKSSSSAPGRYWCWPDEVGF